MPGGCAEATSRELVRWDGGGRVWRRMGAAGEARERISGGDCGGLMEPDLGQQLALPSLGPC